MRIERIHVDAFGRLVDFDTGAEPLGPLVVVHGPNEAGKSTLFSFLTTSLYGFSPANRDSNPHVPWGADEAGGRIHLRTGSADCLVVERRLRSSPTGRLLRGEVALDLRNQPVDAVQHVPRGVFRQVYAVTLAELAGLDDDTWARIQDRVLGSMGASDLASARDLADALEKEAGEIWRPNRRGNQRLRDLREDMRSLRGRRGDAIRADREIRARIEERESLQIRLDDVRHELRRDRLVVERVQELLPLRRQLDRIRTLRAEGGDPAELDGLPPDLKDHVERVTRERERTTAELAEIEDALAAPRRTIERFGPEQERLLESRARIEAFLRSARSGTDRDRVREVENDLRDVSVQLEAAAAPLRRAPLDDEAMRRIEGLSIDLLRDRIQRRGMRVDRPEGPEAGNVPRWLAGLLLAAGAGLLAAGLASGTPVLAGSGAALLALGVWLARPGRGSDRPATADTATLDREIASLLDGLDLKEEHLAPPTPQLAASLERLRELVLKYRARTRELEELATRIEARTRQAGDLARALERSEPDGPDAFERALEDELRQAERVREASDQARGEVERLERSRARVGRERSRITEELAALRAAIDRIAGEGEDEDDAVARTQRRLDRHARADRLEEELRSAHPDLEDRIARIRDLEDQDASWAVSEEELADRRVRIEEAEARVEELSGRIRELGRDIEHLREGETVDSVDSALDAMRETEARLIRERDRTWVLGQLVREADRRFREEHQPDLLRRASSYLSRLTGGRYERLLVDERSGHDLFHLTGPALPTPVPLAPPISTGTLEQAYLALRLAIVDHLDRDHDPLPLFIDEAFVNWDEERRDQGLEVLAEVARERQVFAFTCHPEMAARLEGHGARRVTLER